MDPSDIPNGHGADLGVSMSELKVEKFKNELDNLHLGDKIAFNATIVSLGDHHHLHHLRAMGIKKIPGHMELHAHAHTDGRYKLKVAMNETELT
jgi:hypothetical protein